MIYEQYIMGKLKPFMKRKVVENDLKYKTNYEYYKGNHWLVPGITTTAGINVVNTRDINRVYIGIVDNKIKDCVDTIGNLVFGIENTEITKNENIDIDWKTFVEDINQNGLLYNRAFFKIGKNKEEKITLKVFNTREILWEEDEFGNLKEVVQYRELGEEEFEIYTYTRENEKTIYREYKSNQLVYEGEIELFPIGKIEMKFDYVSNLIPNQDLINIYQTQEYEINKFHADPLLHLKGIKLLDNNGKSIDPRRLNLSSGGIIRTDLEAEIIRIKGESVSQEFIEELKEKIKGLYQLGKINALRNDDLSGITSGYALELKMIDTIAFVNKIRDKIMKGLEDVIKLLDIVNGEEEFKIRFGDFIPKSIKERIEEAKLLKELGYTEEEVKNYIGI